MRKIYRFMMVSVAATAAMTSCQRENLEPEVQHQETIEVKVSLGQQTKGFTDLEGITWEVGDQIKYAGGVELVSEPLAAEQISEDGYTASFTFPAVLNEMDRTGWFVSTKCHPGNFNEVEFTLGQGSGNIFTQEAAVDHLQEAQLQLIWLKLINLVKGLSEAVIALIRKACNQVKMLMHILPCPDSSHNRLKRFQLHSSVNLLNCGWISGLHTYLKLNKTRPHTFY
mgnify:CR=1 FL=1